MIDPLVDRWRDAGQGLLAQTQRHTLVERGVSTERVEAVSTELLFDPLVFAALTDGEAAPAIEPLLWAATAPALRPASAVAHALDDGRVVLPTFGFLSGAAPGAAIALDRHATIPELCARYELAWEPLARIAPNTRVWLHPHRHPVLQPFLERRSAQVDEVEVSAAAKQNRHALALAWALIERAWPAQRDELERDLRAVVIMRHPKLYSMAAMAIHGAIFINTRGAEGPLYFVEELVHQGGHVTFSKIIADWQAFLAVPYDTPMTVLTGEDCDPRSLGDAYHGNYTLVRMAQTFARLLAVEPPDPFALDAGQRHELRGRLTLTLIRLELGLSQIEHPQLYTADGYTLHQHLAEASSQLERAHGGLRRDLDLSDQPYVFEPDRFVARNPLD